MQVTSPSIFSSLHFHLDFREKIAIKIMILLVQPAFGWGGSIERQLLFSVARRLEVGD